jgi:hypothetical protein
MNRRTVIAGVAAAAALPFGSCGMLPDYRVRYRLDVALDARGRVRQGASVLETKYFMNGALGRLDGIVFHTATKGDAIEFDMGPEGSVFCLLGGAAQRGGFPADTPQAILMRALPHDVAYNVDYNVGFAAMEKLRGEFSVEERLWPVLLWMPDRRTLASAQFLDKNTDALGGVHITAVTMTITDAPVSRGLQDRLPWWKDAHREIVLSHLDLYEDNLVQG